MPQEKMGLGKITILKGRVDKVNFFHNSQSQVQFIEH